MLHHQFNTFWHGAALSPIEWVCLSSFIERGHKVRLFCFEEMRVPKGVVLADASEILPREEIVLFNGSIAGFTDLFRYKLILRTGEWWIDTDVYCLREDIPDCQYAWARQDDDLINGAVLKFPANDEKLEVIYEIAAEIGQTFWTQRGPDLLTKQLSSETFANHFGSRKEFYPVHWLETFLFWLPHCAHVVEQKCYDASFVHLWTSVFPQMGVDRFSRPPAGSFLDHVFAPHRDDLFLKETTSETFNQSITGIKRYLAEHGDCSQRLVGYNIGPFSVNEYAV